MTQQFNAFWRWTDSSGVAQTAPFLFEDPDGDFLGRVERYLAPRWRRDFPSNYAAWAAEASRTAPKPIPYLNLPEPPIPEVNVLWFPCVASQYAHIAAIFNVELPVGQKVELVTNAPLWRRSSLFFGTFVPSTDAVPQYVTTLYVASRRTATGDPTTGPFICVLVDWRYFARSVPFEIIQEQEGDAYFFDQVAAILERYDYLSVDDLNAVKTFGICSDAAKALAVVPLDQNVFAEGAPLPLLIDAALYCRGAYLYNGLGVVPGQTQTPSARYPIQVGFPTVDATGTNVPKPKYSFPDYWTSTNEQGATVDPTPAVNVDKSLSLTGYVDVPAVLNETSTAPDFIPSNAEQLKMIAGYVGQAVETLANLSPSATFWLGDYVGPDEYLYIPNGEFDNEQNSIAGLNTCINFPIFSAASKPWDFKRGQILVDKTTLGPFRYRYSAVPVEYVESDFYTGWRFVGPFMDAENTVEASNSVIGVQGNGVSLGFEPVAPCDNTGFNTYGVTESRIVLVTSGTYEVYYAADAPVPIGCGAVVDWNFDGSRFLFSAVNASQGWNGAAYGTLYTDFTQNETRDALATVVLSGEDKALRSVVEAAGGCLSTARYMCYSPFSKSGDTMASGTRVCVIRNATLKRFEIIQAECD